MEVIKIDIGIDKKHREAIAESLKHVLADTYLLYLKTQNFHWNVTGPHFNSLHTMFETQYNALALAADEIAERIRALGFYAPGSFEQYTKLANIKEATTVPSDQAMLEILLRDHETLIKSLARTLSIAEEANDQPTVDLATQRMQDHEKTAWMLQSSLA